MEAGSSVNAIQWAPWEHGLYLAAGCADGKVYVLSRSSSDEWDLKQLPAHDSGINGICWGPVSEPCILMAENNDLMNP